MAIDADVMLWAERIFGQSQLGDARRTARLVKTAASLETNGGGNIAQAHKWDAPGQEGGYRLLRNPKVSVSAMDEAAFQASAQRVPSIPRLLAIDDSTSLSYAHKVAGELGYTTSKPEGKAKGLFVHSTLLVNADSKTTEGLIAQHRWHRDDALYGKKHQRRQAPYVQKESYKWTRNAAAMRTRLQGKMDDVIAVCDRESDIFDYLYDKVAHTERFIVRAAQDRALEKGDVRFFAHVAASPKRGDMSVQVAQRGERPARVARLSLRAQPVTLPAPRGSELYGTNKELTLSLVLAQEAPGTSTGAPLCWNLLTTEAIASTEQLRDILRCYGLRWRIEELHKAWKIGAKV